MMTGYPDNGSFQIAKDDVIGSDHSKIDTHTLLHDRIGKLLHDAFSILYMSETPEGLLQVVLTIRILDMG